MAHRSAARQRPCSFEESCSRGRKKMLILRYGTEMNWELILGDFWMS